MFQTKVVQKIKTHILCSVTFFRKSCGLWNNVEKCCTSGQVTDGNMAHAHCMLDTSGYRHTLTIFNIYSHYNSGCRNASEYYVIRTFGCLVAYFAVQLCFLSEGFRSCYRLSCMSVQRFSVVFLLFLISFKEIPGFRLPQVGHGHFHHISFSLRALSLSATVVQGCS